MFKKIYILISALIVSFFSIQSFADKYLFVQSENIGESGVGANCFGLTHDKPGKGWQVHRGSSNFDIRINGKNPCTIKVRPYHEFWVQSDCKYGYPDTTARSNSVWISEESQEVAEMQLHCAKGPF